MQKITKLLPWLAMIFFCLAGSGCAEFIADAGQQLDYDQRVRDARQSGLSERDAERKAFEEQFFGDPH